MLLKDYYRVVVLFHATLRTLYTSLKPRHNTFGVKYMFALELLSFGFPDLLKTNGTCFGKVCKAFPVLDGFAPAFCPRLGH